MSHASEYTTPLSGKPYYRNTGVIKAANQNGELFCVGEISYERFDDQNFQYVVTPYWNQIRYLPVSVFSGLPGFDFDIKKDKYYRVNMTPTFIQMRTPGEAREDLWELLDEVGLDYYDRFEWLLRTDKRCGDDNLSVVRKREVKSLCFDLDGFDFNDLQPGDKVSLSSISDIGRGKKDLGDYVYRLLANGVELYIEEETRWFSQSERMAMLYLLFQMKEHSNKYHAVRQEMGIERAKKEGKYKGRKRITIDPLKLKEVIEQFKIGAITEEEALKSLNVTRSTFYRRMKEIGRSEEEI